MIPSIPPTLPHILIHQLIVVLVVIFVGCCFPKGWDHLSHQRRVQNLTRFEAGEGNATPIHPHSPYPWDQQLHRCIPRRVDDCHWSQAKRRWQKKEGLVQKASNFCNGGISRTSRVTLQTCFAAAKLIVAHHCKDVCKSVRGVREIGSGVRVGQSREECWHPGMSEFHDVA